MQEVIFTVSINPETGKLIAFWDDPIRDGGIATQADSLDQLQREIIDAVLCHFDEDELPQRVKVHFQDDPSISVLEPA